jgi:hypothetical protein
MPGYPYTSWIALISIIVVILSMPFISGQSSGLIAGFIMVVLYSLTYAAVKYFGGSKKKHTGGRLINNKRYARKLSMEFSKELIERDKQSDKDKK